MNQLKDLKPGDKVIHTNENGVRSVRVVLSLSAFDTELYLEDRSTTVKPYSTRNGEGTGRWTKGSKIEVATPELLVEVEREISARELRNAEENARIAADPKTPLVSRFKAGDFEPWEKLTLEQLEQIKVWLDAVR